MSTEAVQYTVSCDQVAWLRITRSDSERNLTLNHKPFIASPPVFSPELHSDTSLESFLHYFLWCRNCLALPCSRNRSPSSAMLVFCRAPVKKCLPQLSWGWRSLDHTLLAGGRRGSAAHSPSVLTESCTDSLHWQVCPPSVYLLVPIALSSSAAPLIDFIQKSFLYSMLPCYISFININSCSEISHYSSLEYKMNVI